MPALAAVPANRLEGVPYPASSSSAGMPLHTDPVVFVSSNYDTLNEWKSLYYDTLDE